MGVESASEWEWNQHQNGSGISIRMGVESASEWEWNQHQNGSGISIRMSSRIIFYSAQSISVHSALEMRGFAFESSLLQIKVYKCN